MGIQDSLKKVLSPWFSGDLESCDIGQVDLTDGETVDITLGLFLTEKQVSMRDGCFVRLTDSDGQRYYEKVISPYRVELLLKAHKAAQDELDSLSH